MEVKRQKTDELCHHGVKGQRWGVRRYQNEDGSLTNAGKRRIAKKIKNTGGYSTGLYRQNQSTYKNKDLIRKHVSKDLFDEYSKAQDEATKAVEKYNKYYPNMSDKKEKQLWNDIEKHNKKIDEINKKVVDELVGKYSNKKVKVLYENGLHRNYTVGELVEDALWNTYIDDIKYKQ